MKKIITLILVFTLSFKPQARADMFGGDLVYLAQILANALKQLVELKNMVQNGKDQLELGG